MDIKSLYIYDIGLSNAAVNALQRNNIIMVVDLMKLKESDLLSMRTIGKKIANEIMEKQQEYACYAVDDGSEDELGKMTKDSFKRIRIQDEDLSARAIHCLTKNGIFTIEDLLLVTEWQLSNIRNLGKKTLEEILHKITEYKSIIADLPDKVSDVFKERIDPIEHYDEWLEDSVNQQRTINYLKEKNVSIDVLDMLSVKAYNLLRFNNYSYLHQIVFITDDELFSIPRMDISLASEIKKNIRYYFKENKEAILSGVGANQSVPQSELSTTHLSAIQMVSIPEYRNQILKYIKSNDYELEMLNLSVRSRKTLFEHGYYKLSDIVFLNYYDLSRISKLGKTSIDEILSVISKYLKQHDADIQAFVNGDSSVLVSMEAIRNRILNIYKTMEFKGLHLPEIIEKLDLPESVDDEVIKKTIGKLIVENQLEYIDYLVYRVYPPFALYLDKCVDEDARGVRCAKRRLQGETLESIAKEENYTRERIRQIVNKTNKIAHSLCYSETGLNLFDEDYYSYFYENYDIDQQECVNWLGITLDTYKYLAMNYTKGKKNIEEALNDSELDVGLKLKIKNYLNRNKIFVEGNWLKNSRKSLEDYVLMKFCQDEMSFEDYVEIYNSFLADQGIPFSDEFYCTETNIRTRTNKVLDSRLVLRKYNQKLRYYDIDSRDYSELLEVLNLESFENIELSTLKFIEDYPGLMERYDIRDQYELHNLLKKIIPDGTYNAFKCDRMPIISFGEFDRDEAVRDIMINNAPISRQDLVELIHTEYGYDRDFIIWNMLEVVNDHYHNGLYTVDSKAMPSDHMEALKDALTEDFYYFNEVKRIYRELIPDADIDTVTPYNLKLMGFTVLSKYILQNWPSLEEYFKHYLLEADIVDLNPLRKRFCYIQMWSQTLNTLKNNYEILEFAPNQIVNIRKLEASGINKQMFVNFCDEVYAFIDDGVYFSAKTLKSAGFSSELYDLGFEDWFYANILCCDPRFSYSKMFGNIILFKGHETITIKSFVTDQIKQAEKIDIFDLMNDLNDDFGCNVKNKFDITEKIQGSEIYYDPILERLYANAELYYRELDEDMENV